MLSPEGIFLAFPVGTAIRTCTCTCTCSIETWGGGREEEYLRPYSIQEVTSRWLVACNSNEYEVQENIRKLKNY